MEFENKLLFYAMGFMIFYWSMQFAMLGLFGVGYCAGKGFLKGYLSCVVPVVHGLPLVITLVIFIPIYYYALVEEKEQ